MESVAVDDDIASRLRIHKSVPIVALDQPPGARLAVVEKAISYVREECRVEGTRAGLVPLCLARDAGRIRLHRPGALRPASLASSFCSSSILTRLFPARPPLMRVA